MTKILVAGPHGAGKTVLVRRVMSLYDRQTRISGGVGGLPRAYTMQRRVDIPRGEGHHDVTWSGELEILGNYDLDSRSRHGLTQFDRYRTDLDHVLKHANATPWPVLCEGGLIPVRRLHTDWGKRFCSGCHIIYMSPDYSRLDSIRNRGHLEDAIHERHLGMVVRTIEAMAPLGATVSMVKDRDKALRLVCSLIDESLPWQNAITPAQDYR